MQVLSRKVARLWVLREQVRLLALVVAAVLAVLNERMRGVVSHLLQRVLQAVLLFLVSPLRIRGLFLVRLFLPLFRVFFLQVVQLLREVGYLFVELRQIQH